MRAPLPRIGGLVLLCAAIALAQAGCSHYSFSPSARPHLKTVAVPVLANETLEYGAGQDLTDAIIEVFSDDNTLRVVDEDSADSVVSGKVSLYERSVLSYDAGGDPREYKVRVVASLTYEDVVKERVIWEGDVEGWAVYSITQADTEYTTEEEAREASFARLAQDLLSETVQGW